jgi:hypothetical protein
LPAIFSTVISTETNLHIFSEPRSEKAKKPLHTARTETLPRKKTAPQCEAAIVSRVLRRYFASRSSETESFLRPFALRAASTLRPLAVAILWRKPCLLILFLRDGWNVLFIAVRF